MLDLLRSSLDLVIGAARGLSGSAVGGWRGAALGGKDSACPLIVLPASDLRVMLAGPHRLRRLRSRRRIVRAPALRARDDR